MRDANALVPSNWATSVPMTQKANNNGVMTIVASAFVTTEPILVSELAASVSSKVAGAVVTFSGDVRDNDHGRSVASLEYEAHPTAQKLLEKVAQEVAGRHEVISVAVAHRHGPIPSGESALVAAVSAKHRQAAFAACTELVDEVKAQIPIWKHQIFTDGTDEWVNCA
jgi:molybdopterin synthase catalytic subunit